MVNPFAFCACCGGGAKPGRSKPKREHRRRRHRRHHAAAGAAPSRSTTQRSDLVPGTPLAATSVASGGWAGGVPTAAGGGVGGRGSEWQRPLHTMGPCGAVAAEALAFDGVPLR
jgi:hypothetical protein